MPPLFVVTADATTVYGTALAPYQSRVVTPPDLEGYVALSSVGNPPPASSTYRATSPTIFSSSVVTPYTLPTDTYEATSINQMYEMAPMLDELYAYVYRIGILNSMNSVGNATEMSFTLQNNTISHTLELTMTMPNYFKLLTPIYPIIIPPEESVTFSLVPSEAEFKEYIHGIYDGEITVNIRPLNVISPVYVKTNPVSVINPDTLAAAESFLSDIAQDGEIVETVDEVVDELLDTDEGFENVELIAATITEALTEAEKLLEDPSYTSELFLEGSTEIPPADDTGTPPTTPVVSKKPVPNSVGARRLSKRTQAAELIARLRLGAS